MGAVVGAVVTNLGLPQDGVSFDLRKFAFEFLPTANPLFYISDLAQGFTAAVWTGGQNFRRGGDVVYRQYNFTHLYSPSHAGVQPKLFILDLQNSSPLSLSCNLTHIFSSSLYLLC